MALPKDRFNHLFDQLSKKYQENVLDYMEYLAQKSANEIWESFPEEESELSDEERRQLGEERDYVSGEEAKREFRLHVDLP